MCDKDLTELFGNAEIAPDKEARQKAKTRMLAYRKGNTKNINLRRIMMKTIDEKNIDTESKEMNTVKKEPRAKFKITKHHLQGAMAMLLVCVITFSAVTVTNGNFPFGTLFNTSAGDGTQGNPFEVKDIASLQKVGTGTDDWTLDKQYKQTADIDMTGQSFAPIAPRDTPFTGSYDGGGYEISNLTIITGTFERQGLFGRSEGSVSNVRLVNVSVTGISYCAGGVVGSNKGTVTNCTVTGTVTNGDYNVGGVVGYNFNYGTVTNCTVTGTVSGKSYVGGVVGYNKGTVTNCTVTGTITASNSDVGGVIGYNDKGTVTNCAVACTVNGGNSYVGGVVGNNNGGTVTICAAACTVSGKDNVGGVAGSNTLAGKLTNCYSTDSVTGTTKENTGGVIGYNYGTVTNCYTACTVSGNDDTGGVAGYNFDISEVVGCIALSQNLKTANDKNGVYRVAGACDGTLKNNYAWSGMSLTYNKGIKTGSSTKANSLNGKNLTAAELKTRAAWEKAGFVFGDDGIWVWDGANMPSLNGVGTPQPWPEYLK